MNNREYDYLFKLVIIGNSGVGKSSVLLRFADDQFSETYLTTIGVDFRFKTLPIDGKNVKLQIWDTAGQERFRTITNAYYKGADGIVITYDTTSEQSFLDINTYWMNEVESYAEKDVDLLLLGNKCEMTEQRKVSKEMAQEYATKKNMKFFEVSAKTSDFIEDAFVSIAKDLMKKRDLQLAEKKKNRMNNKSEQINQNNNNNNNNIQMSNQNFEYPNSLQSQSKGVQLNKSEQKTSKTQKVMNCCL